MQASLSRWTNAVASLAHAVDRSTVGVESQTAAERRGCAWRFSTAADERGTCASFMGPST